MRMSCSRNTVGTGTTMAKSLTSPLKSLLMVMMLRRPSRTRITSERSLNSVASALAT